MLDMLDDIGKMVTECRKVRSTHDLSIIVAIDGAVQLMREVFFRKHEKVEFTDEPDELFLYDGIPVRLRVKAHPGIAVMAKTSSVVPRSCCDQTACITMAVTMSWRSA